MRALRLLKQETALLSALCDLGGVWSVAEVTAALSRTADVALSLALSWLLRDAARGGRILLKDPSDPVQGCGFFMLAMGKHGAFELNYSSDIDVIALYDPEERPSRRWGRARRLLRAHDAADRPLLAERTADGYVFRVDLRLRPDPGATAIAISVAGGLRLLRERRPELGARGADQGAACAGDLAARASLPRRPAALHLAPSSRLRGHRRHPRDEAPDPCP